MWVQMWDYKLPHHLYTPRFAPWQKPSSMCGQDVYPKRLEFDKLIKSSAKAVDIHDGYAHDQAYMTLLLDIV